MPATLCSSLEVRGNRIGVKTAGDRAPLEMSDLEGTVSMSNILSESGNIVLGVSKPYTQMYTKT